MISPTEGTWKAARISADCCVVRCHTYPRGSKLPDERIIAAFNNEDDAVLCSKAPAMLEAIEAAGDYLSGRDEPEAQRIASYIRNIMLDFSAAEANAPF